MGARGVVWDTRDADYTPMEPSTRNSVVGGKASIDRVAVRVAAEDLAWAHRDLIEQVGEGGVEALSVHVSVCSWDTVLAFHHPGFA